MYVQQFKYKCVTKHTIEILALRIVCLHTEMWLLCHTKLVSVQMCIGKKLQSILDFFNRLSLEELL